MEVLQWDITTIAHVIQIAVAPVFLLAGIAGLLGVMTNRLGRVIDRARSLARGQQYASTEHEHALINQENRNLLQRGRFINLAIAFAGTSALLVCLVIMALFTASLLSMNFSKIVAVLFIISMILLIVALSFFLLEVFLATSLMQSGLAKTEALIHPKQKP
ncbi:MAG: DUF2721 domain-containing protein [Pseudomonadales bacterium]|nr:DUF2721 domain-containing protein [Pseudomonadales bacterium]